MDPKPEARSFGLKVALSIGGLAVGLALVLVFLKLARVERSPASVSARQPVASAAPTAQAPQATQAVTSDAKPPTDQPKEVPPLDPIGTGKSIVPIGGKIPAVPPPSIPPVATTKLPSAAPPAVVAPAPSQLVIGLVRGIAAPDLESRARALAAALGGTARAYQRSVGKGDPDSGVIMLVPPAKLEEALTKLRSSLKFEEGESWEGTPGARASRLTASIRTAIADLGVKRSELLIRYYEDAPSVKAIDEQIESARASLASLRLGSETDRFAVIQVALAH